MKFTYPLSFVDLFLLVVLKMISHDVLAFEQDINTLVLSPIGSNNSTYIALILYHLPLNTSCNVDEICPQMIQLWSINKR
jgi:hypothetical protein